MSAQQFREGVERIMASASLEALESGRLRSLVARAANKLRADGFRQDARLLLRAYMESIALSVVAP